MERPNITNDQALNQARDTVGTYLQNAVAIIDSHFGVGYAAEHPALVAECIHSQALDYNNCSLTAALYSLGDQMQEIGRVLADGADTLGDAINPPPKKRHFDNPVRGEDGEYHSTAPV